MTRFFYVYVLVSETDPSIHYTGLTRDLSGRLHEHNRGPLLTHRKAQTLANRNGYRILI